MTSPSLGKASRLLPAIAFGIAAACASAQAPTEAAKHADAAELPTIVVSGEQPGPGLWKVTSGDHVLWILGTLSPLPKNMHWQPKDVEAAIAAGVPCIGFANKAGKSERLAAAGAVDVVHLLSTLRYVHVVP